MKKIAVIGAGISGLSCAYELKKAGFKVSVFESNFYAGGRMATRVKDGLSFDFGANFFIKLYTSTHNLAREFKIPWQIQIEGLLTTFRNNSLNSLSQKNFLDYLFFSPLTLKSKFKLLIFLFKMSKLGKNIDFWNLNTAINQDLFSANSFTKQHANKEILNYVIDPFISTYQFHSSKEISAGGMFALINLIKNKPSKFILAHTKTGMSDIPNALAEKLNVKFKTKIDSVKKTKKGIQIKTENKSFYFDSVIIASTANQTKKMYKNPSKNQSEFLSKVKYASTINVSFKIPVGTLDNLMVISVPFVESKIISEYTNEETKRFTHNGFTLVNVGLHEQFAKKIMNKSDAQIFKIVGDELLRVCPRLTSITNHDLQRWPFAMPKFYAGYLTTTANFWKNGQGDNNIFFCGDYLNSPWIEGSIRCGKRVAKLLVEKNKKQQQQNKEEKTKSKKR